MLLFVSIIEVYLQNKCKVMTIQTFSTRVWFEKRNVYDVNFPFNDHSQRSSPSLSFFSYQTINRWDRISNLEKSVLFSGICNPFASNICF
jgi:hypothetical protein